MPAVRRRPTNTAAPTRRRDRARVDDDVEDEEEEEEDEDVDVTRRKSSSATAKRTSTKAKSKVEDDDDEDEVDDDDDNDDDEEEDETPKARRSTKRSEPSGRNKSTSRSSRDTDDDDDDDDDEPRAKRSSSTPPPGIHLGAKGGQETLKAGGGDFRHKLAVDAEPVLVKFLENEEFTSFRQHWVPSGKSNRPYTCIGEDCPLCDGGDNRPAAVFMFNVLLLSGDGKPSNKFLQLGTLAFEALKKAATPKGKTQPLYTRDYFAISMTKAKRRNTWNFQPVKERDLEDDWEEVLDRIDLEEIPALVKKAKAKMFDWNIVPTSTKKSLEKVADYLSDDASLEDDDD